MSGPNEPAFPRPCGAANREEQNLEQDGMSLREYYAGEALKGLVVGFDREVADIAPDRDAGERRLVARARRLADLLIAELNQKGKT